MHRVEPAAKRRRIGAPFCAARVHMDRVSRIGVAALESPSMIPARLPSNSPGRVVISSSGSRSYTHLDSIISMSFGHSASSAMASIDTKKYGQAGTRIAVKTNMFKIRQIPKKVFYHYHGQRCVHAIGRG